jgi:hypothetical protein
LFPRNFSVPDFGRTEHQSLVQSRGEVAVRYESRHAGTQEKKVKLD